jgi:hypothetical protein
MSARIKAGLAIAALALASSAFAQGAPAPLAQLDPWGVGWLGRSDGALPATIWTNTSGESLAPVYAGLQPKDLAPSGRAALRRIMLSAAKAPADGALLIPERLRLIEQLGETERAIDLRKRFPDTDWGKTGELVASEYELANGRSQTACARVASRRADDQAWMPVRAFCYALAGDFDGAAMIGERLSATDSWLLSAIETMRAPAAKKPEGRYATAFETAVSVAAKLPAPVNAFAATPSDIAAAVVLHPVATLEQRRAALRVALDGGKIKPADVVAVLNLKDETPAQKAAGGRPQAARVDFLQHALAAATVADAKTDAKATAYAAALKSAESLSDFRLVSAALGDAIKALPRNDATAANAEAFARVALLLGDIKLAGDWRKLMDEKADPWAAARIDLMLSYAGVGADKAGAILDRLLAALPPAPETAAARTNAPQTPQSRQLDLRRIENTRALFLFAGTGRSLSPEQRALLASQRSAGRGVSDAAIARIASAADQDADGEAALAAIALLGPDVSAVSFAGLADLLAQLRRAGFEKDADAIALEALQVWKAL